MKERALTGLPGLHNERGEDFEHPRFEQRHHCEGGREGRGGRGEDGRRKMEGEKRGEEKGAVSRERR